LNYSEDFVESRKLTIVDNILKCVKKGKEDEQIDALKCLSVVLVTLGSDKEEIFVEISSPLIFHVNQNKSAHVRAQAVSTLAVGCFVGVTAKETTLTLLDQLLNWLQNIRPIVTELHHSLLLALGALITTLPPSLINDEIYWKTIQPFVDLLEEPELRTRELAGENIALLFEILRSFHDDSFELEHFEGETSVHDILDRLNSLSAENSRYIAKKDKLSQRQTFKLIYKSVKDGELPSETLRFGSQSFIFEGWVRLKPLDLFREALATGFQHHFLHNSLLGQIFNISINKQAPKVSLTQKEKRAFKSPNSAVVKTRTKTRGKERNKRNQVLEEEI